MSGGKASRRRWWVWLPALGLAGWLALFGDRSPDGKAATLSVPLHAAPSAESVARPLPVVVGPKTAVGAEPEPIEMLVPRDQWVAAAPADTASTARRDLFSTRNWNPPAAPASSIPAVPVAPPLPFKYLGKKFEGETWEVYLTRGEQSFIAREGQTLDGVYRVTKIAPPSLTLTYLPLDQPQTLMIGDAR